MTFDGLELTPWLLAPGALADSDTAAGNVSTATQTQPGVECASFAIDPKGQSWANAYWYKELGADARVTHLVYEASFLFPTAADAQASQAIEMDIQQTISGVTFNWGLQFDFADNAIRVWNRASKSWNPTGQPCPRWPEMEWQRVRLEVSRLSTSVAYNLLTINEQDVLLQQAYPQATVGEKPQINCAIQLDGGKSGTAYRVMVDGVRLATK